MRQGDQSTQHHMLQTASARTMTERWCTLRKLLHMFEQVLHKLVRRRVHARQVQSTRVKVHNRFSPAFGFPPNLILPIEGFAVFLLLGVGGPNASKALVSFLDGDNKSLGPPAPPPNGLFAGAAPNALLLPPPNGLFFFGGAPNGESPRSPNGSLHNIYSQRSVPRIIAW